MQDTAPRDHRTGNKLLYLGFLPVALSVALIVIFHMFPPSEAVFEPGHLLAALNSLFLSLIPFVVAYLSGQSYLKTGSPNMFLIGCALFVFGAGNLVAGWAIDHLGPNTTVTVHNIVCFVASILYIVAALIMAGGVRTEFTVSRRLQVLALAFVILVVFVGVTSAATIGGLIPPFFIVGTGPTDLRLIVLTVAVVLHALSAIIALQHYWRQRSPFLFWYGLALLMIAIGLFAVLIQPAVGSPIGWVGRISQYLGGVYFLVSMIMVMRTARTAGTGTSEMLASFFRDSAIHYVKLMETAKDPIVVADDRGRVYLWNPAAEKVFGFDQGKAVGSSLTNLIGPHDLLNNLLQKGPAERPWMESEMSLKRKDGSIFLSEISGWTTKAADKTMATFIIRDITGRKRMEEKLRESEEKYRRLFTDAGLGIFHSTFDGRFIDVNPALAEMLGYGSPEDVVESIHSISEQVYVDPPRRDQILEGILKEGKTVRTDNRYYRKSGEEWLARLHVRQVSDETGKPVYLEGFVEDVTDRKKMEDKLLEQERFLSSVAKMSPAIVYVFDLETQSSAYVSDGIEKVLGYSPAQIEAMGTDVLARMIRPDDYQSVIDFQSKIKRAADDEIMENEYHARHADGSWRTLRTRERPFLRNADGSVRQKIGIALDVTERRQMEEELRCSRDELESRVRERTAALEKAMDSVTGERRRLYDVLETLPAMIWLLTPDHRVAFVNRAFRERFGEPEGRPCYEYSCGFSEPCTFCESFEALKTGEPHRWEIALQDSVIDVYDFPFIDVDGSPMILQMNIDITEQRRLEEQLRQAQKMEAIGTLAGGIAHDFNNILAAIIGFTEMAMEDVPDPPLIQKDLQHVMTSAIRARELVKQILAFSRKTGHERRPVALAPVIEETAALLRASIPATVDMAVSVSASTDTVMAAPIEIQQIIMNLATNALLAIEDQRGSLEIALSDIDFEPDVVTSDGTSREYLQIMVKDTGVGMAPEVMKRIFDPFFTTREVGKGSGMGLAMIYGIVKDLGGMVTVESEPGRGSTFRVFLPKAGVQAGGETRQTALPRGNERILFVDDEPLLVEWGKDTLERLGYNVTAVEDGEQALKIFSADPFFFDLVVTDQAMPKMPGSDLCAEFLRIRNDIPIILCTGHSETMSPERAEKIGIREFLLKPVTRQELASAVRRELDAAN